MLDYTKMAIKQTITDLKRTDYIRNVATQVIYIIYLIYTLIAGAGYLAANIVLLVLSVSYTVFFLTITSCGKTPEGKNVKNAGTKIYVWAKRLIKLFTLGLTIYGICTAVEKVTPLSVILAALMIVGWILQIVFEVLIKILTNRVNFILEGLEADLDNMLKPVRSVGNFFKKVTGKEVAPPKEPTKNQLKLKAKVEAFRAEQKRKKEEERLRKEAQKNAEKTLEKERRREQKQSIRIENQLLRAARKSSRSKIPKRMTLPKFCNFLKAPRSPRPQIPKSRHRKARKKRTPSFPASAAFLSARNRPRFPKRTLGRFTTARKSRRRKTPRTRKKNFSTKNRPCISKARRKNSFGKKRNNLPLRLLPRKKRKSRRAESRNFSVPYSINANKRRAPPKFGGGAFCCFQTERNIPSKPRRMSS